MEEAPSQRRARPALWDRSPNAQVRRKYRRTVLRLSKEAPPSWAAPQEIEERAGDVYKRQVLARAGAKVALLDLNLEAAQQFAEEIQQEGGTAVSYTHLAPFSITCNSTRYPSGSAKKQE